MDRSLVERWKKGEPPFDGDVVSVSTFDAGVARVSIANVARDLRALDATVGLLGQWDFHERDGFVAELSNMSWSELEFASRSDAAVLDRVASVPGLRRLWVPESMVWMLRWGMDEFGTIRVDVVAPDRVLVAVSLLVARLVEADVVRRRAKPFFDSTWKLMSRSGSLADR